jgi:hypothetical protein
MSERHWQRSALAQVSATGALAVLGAAAVTGCGGSASPSASQGQAAATQQQTAQVAFTPAQLQSALLTQVNGHKAAAAPESGDYGMLPDVQTSRQTMAGVTVTPAKCAQATTQTGFNSAAFSSAPASVVSFKLGQDGVSEVLVSTSPRVATTALGTKLPAGCAHYRATVDGKSFRYSVREVPVPGLGQQAHALNVKAAGYSTVNVWSVVYRGSGFVGAVTMVGPDASEQSAMNLAQTAFAHASQALTQS